MPSKFAKRVVLAICLVLAHRSAIAQPKPDDDQQLRRDLEAICSGYEGVDFDRLAKLGDPEKVKKVVLDMMMTNANAREGLGAKFLTCSAFLAGHFKEKGAMDTLKTIVQDETREGIGVALRAVAARALGKIDPVASKDSLFFAFDRAQPSEMDLRLAVVEALSQANDSQILGKIEQYSRGETSEYSRKRMEAMISRMKARMQR